MKKIVTLVSTLAFLAIAASAFAANAVRISQVYGGGGSASAGPTYNVDYVEIFNSSNAAVNVGGWTIEYASAAGSWGSSGSNIFTFPANTLIQPCKYLLVASATPSAGGGTLTVTPDFTFSIAASATNGNVGLFSAVNTNVACAAATNLIDKVGYGTGACNETAAVGVLSTTTGAVRNNGGITDTDNNLSDFTVTTGPVPHNSASAANPNCSTVPTRTSTWGAVKQIYR
jgi:hypothetical protein